MKLPMVKPKNHNLNFIPTTISFNALPEMEEPRAEDEQNFDLEKQVLQMVFSLKSDKERCVLLLLILREYGFNFDYGSCARSLHIDWRWFMRVKAEVRKKLTQFNPETI